MSEIYVLGVQGEQLDARQLELISRCRTVIASSRHRHLVAELQGIRILPIAPVQAMLDGLAKELKQGNVAVLASGDPLFFGIGRTLKARYGSRVLHIFPALSSMQLGCAALNEPWDDLHWLSLHGRDRGRLPGLLLQHEKTLILTDHRNTPDRLAAELLENLNELGALELIRDLRLAVVENAGLARQRIIRGDLAEIAGQDFAPLNIMLIKQPQYPASPRLGLTEAEFAHSRGLITKDEVRSAALHRLRLPREGVFWDIGAGSGSVSISAALLNPGLQVFAVEREPEQLANIKENIRTLRSWNVQPCPGEAPEVLNKLPDPDRIFVGGSGGALQPILEQTTKRLAGSGRIVVSAVLGKTARLAPEILHQAGLRVEISRIRVTRTLFADQEENTMNPITLITGRK